MSNAKAIDCPHCEGSGEVVESYGRRVNVYPCEPCEGQGGGFACWGCGEFSTGPLCESCKSDRSCADDFEHRQAHGPEMAVWGGR